MLNLPEYLCWGGEGLGDSCPCQSPACLYQLVFLGSVEEVSGEFEAEGGGGLGVEGN